MLKWMFAFPLVFLIFSISSLQAQYNVAVSAGFNFGYSQLMNVDHINTKSIRSHTAFFAGITPSYQLNEKVKISTELQYSEIGTYFRVHDFTPENDLRFHGEGRYLRLIPHLNYFLFKNFSINGGPNVGLLIDSESTKYYGMRSTKEMPHYGDIISNFDMGATLGMKYYVDHYFISISYYQGFTDISDVSYTNQFAEVIPNTSQRNHYIQFGLGAQLCSTSDTE